tara:strand:- start:2354 stop:3322 length:969 start_codon:yes stop_codon:yes gene_type:complete
MKLEFLNNYLKKDLKDLESQISERTKTKVSLINSLSKHILQGGGKRLRPIVLILANKLCKQNKKNIIDASVVVEFIHAATLLHDDVVDKSKMRHNKKTANSIWGNQGAVLVGDFLYSRAFEIIVEINNPRIYQILAKTTNLISQGEVLQLMNLNNINVTEKIYLEIISRKTAKLFEASCEIGSVLANNNPKENAALASFGNYFGLAYQLRNDYLDYFGEKNYTGKNIIEDFSEGKPTLPIIYAMKKVNDKSKKIIKDTFIKQDLKKMNLILDILLSCGADKYIQKKIDQITLKAIKELEIFKDNKIKETLISLANFCSTRRG